MGVQVTATNQTGPKVIVFNLNATTINLQNLKDLGVMYDGKLIQPAPNMDAILHAKPTDNPSFAIVVTQSGVQVLVLVPHFSTHSITITNMSKVIPAVPEFPFANTCIDNCYILYCFNSKNQISLEQVQGLLFSSRFYQNQFMKPKPYEPFLYLLIFWYTFFYQKTSPLLNKTWTIFNYI